MSFATVLGGTVTLIGTSTNLVVSGLQEEKYGTSNPEHVFGFFTITPYGVPYAIWGKVLLCVAFCSAESGLPLSACCCDGDAHNLLSR